MNGRDCVSVATRREVRCRQVLDAAAECFRQHGFHAASMAEIAETAGMSVGHIYRYFSSKEAIIAAIVAADVAHAHQRFAAFHRETEAGRAMLIRCAEEAVAVASDPARAALFLEVRAEALRNPHVADIVRAADAEIRAVLQTMMAQATGEDVDSPGVAARAEIFSILFEGIAVRIVRDPEADRATVTTLIQNMVERLMPEGGD